MHHLRTKHAWCCVNLLRQKFLSNESNRTGQSLFPNEIILTMQVFDRKFGLCEGREDGKHTGVGFVEISKIYVMRDTIFFAMQPIYAV